MSDNARHSSGAEKSGQALRPRKIELSTLADHVWEQLYVAIIEGRLKAGERLVEMELASQVGTSQGPVRDALQRLERDGLVERRSHSATFVSQMSREEMYEIFLVRSTLESITFRRTAQVITANACDELQTLVEKMKHAAQRDDIVSLLTFDMQFHTTICQWSGNRTLLLLWTPLRAQIQRFVVQYYRDTHSDLTQLALSHQVLVDVLRRNDAEEAERLIKEHIMRIWFHANGDHEGYSGTSHSQVGRASSQKSGSK